jgi:DoxX-like family
VGQAHIFATVFAVHQVMTKAKIHQLLTHGIALVWLANGLGCKVLGLVPRHELIVARILGEAHAHLLTLLIGLGEMGLAAWVWSRLWPRVNAVVQIGLVVVMNTIEAVLAPDLLLWGHWNAVFASFFGLVVYLHTFYWGPKNAPTP